MKLQLGCGEQYLQGYVNIDYPPSEHTVQTASVADLYADILALRYPAVTVEEIRLHHVFEHFTRPIACALLACWFSWLQPGGRLHIEVPDFERTARVALKRFASRKERTVAERHVFGSHEAPWAVHCAGYTPRTLAALLEQYGFRVRATRKTEWRGTYNVTIIAEKGRDDLTRRDFSRITENWLSYSLVDDSETERRLLGVWLNIYDKQVAARWARDG